MKFRAIVAVAIGLGTVAAPSFAANGVPQYSHIVVVMEENHAYNEIIGSSSAPYMNSLASQGALFTNSYAIEHPSDPNYLDLFSGEDQGVTSDLCPQSFTDANLGAELLAKGFTFAGYSEGLPSVGSLTCTSGEYASKHSPWVNWSSGANAIPAADQKPFQGYYPGTISPVNYNNLPTVSWVIPNLDDDMHDGTIQEADTWLQTNIDGYAQWAKTNNSLLIVTWDEDDGTQSNHIPTFFVGANITPGQYSETISHYAVLRTLEDAYGLGYCANSASVSPITDVFSTGGQAAPTGLTATAGNTQVALKWTAATGATSYNIYRGTTSGGEGTSPITSGLTGTSYTDTAVTNGTTYYYTAKALSTAGTSSPSNEASATPNAAPAAPSNLTATTSSTSIKLAWKNNATNATSVNIYRSTNGTSYSLLTSVSASTATYTNTGLSKSTTYYYKVDATNSAGTSAYSNVASAKG